MVFYRKYRPQNLTDLVGQETVKKAIQSAYLNGKLAHAYLFCGPRGTGKTSTARILAKLVNCGKSKDGNPCNVCPICESITDGSNLDLVEIDAASNRGIDDIRSLRETIKLAPTSSPKKVYIIDEVHMLSNEAFNALLKTLEEPPAHALFILATTEVHKIPATILSRVQRLDFKLATPEDLVVALQKIVSGEKIDIDPAALTAIAKKAGGSFRDGTKLLDQLASLNKKIDVETVELTFGSSNFSAVVGLLDCIARKTTGEALECLLEQLNKGISVRELNLQLLDVMRQLILISQGLGERLVKPEMEPADYQSLTDLGKKFELVKLISLTDAFQKSFEQLRYVTIPSLPLEIALVEGCMAAQAPVVQQAPTVVVNTRPILITNNPEPAPAPVAEPVSADTSADLQKLHDRWNYILETVRQSNYSLEALLRSSKIYECAEHSVVFEVPYAFHQRIIESPKSRGMLETLLSDILGRTIRVSTVLGERPTVREDLANVEVAEDDETIRMVAEIFSSDPA